MGVDSPCDAEQGNKVLNEYQNSSYTAGCYMKTGCPFILATDSPRTSVGVMLFIQASDESLRLGPTSRGTIAHIALPALTQANWAKSPAGRVELSWSGTTAAIAVQAGALL